SADVRRHDETSLKARRREGTVVAQWSNLRQAGIAIRRGHTPNIVEVEALRAERRYHRVERLRGRRALTVNRACGDRPLFNRKKRLAGVSIQHVELTALRCLKHDIDAAAIATDRDERGRRR